MIRRLKTTVSVNLVVAILIVGAYLLYGLRSGLPINQQFLGAGPSHGGRGGTGPAIPPWALVALAETLVLGTFIVGRYAGSDMALHRKFCGVIGVVGVFLLIVGQLPHYDPLGEERVLRVVGSPVDSGLAWYAWGSHLVYALVGSNHASAIRD
jgi:hypothetical protein